jgi:CRP/FNR family transcriptional regulator
MPYHQKPEPQTAAPRPADLLRQIPYFTGIDVATLADIAREVRPREVEAGEHILTEGEPCLGLYFVTRGQVRLMKTAVDGREHVLRVLGPGATFNDVAVFDGGPNSDSAIAVGPTRIGYVPTATIQRLIERHPQIARAALRLLSQRQRSLGHLVEDLALRDVTARVARLLLGCIGDHEDMIEKADFACARITHQEIATMVGSVREVVQRALKELERDGAITLERSHINIRSPTKLARWINENAARDNKQN